MVSKRIPIISIWVVIVVLLFGVVAFKNEMEIKSIESTRSTTLDGHKNAKDVANKCISLFQLDEVGKYDKVKDSVYNYLSDDLKELYFPSDKINGVKPASKITITKTVSEKLDVRDYMVKVEFTKVGYEYKEHKVFVRVKNGLMVSMETIK